MQDNISVIIPVFNASTTVRISLDSLKKQNVRVREIILIDNASTDDSVNIIEDYKRKNRHLNIVLIKRSKTGSVASSLNMAIKKSRGNLIISMHSDSSLPANNEITKLTMPFVNDKSVVASYSYVLHPERIWKTYNFWEKCQSARVMGKKIPGLNAKFDCYKKEALLEVGGFDEINFDKFGDGSDADMYFRLRKIGKVTLSNAQVVHLHYLSDNYSLLDWIRKRKNMSITSARLMKMYLLNTDIKGIFSFLTRPILSILPFIPGLKLVGIIVLLLFSFSYTPIMFIHKSTRIDPRIIILPLVNIFLIYFEAFWFVFTLATHKAKRRRI
ncbi:glycosyltransferase family 2 protein [Patescibacteria group bacterium]|nr:glycosyltransferase family 2 protein [Patescibacteria group bacterium]